MCLKRRCASRCEKSVEERRTGEVIMHVRGEMLFSTRLCLPLFCLITLELDRHSCRSNGGGAGSQGLAEALAQANITNRISKGALAICSLTRDSPHVVCTSI